MMHKRMEDLEERRGHFCFSRNGWKLRGRFTFDGACKFCVRFDEQRRTFARYVSQTAYRVARPETIKLSVIFRGHAARPSTGVLIPAFSIPALLSPRSSLSLSLVAKDRWQGCVSIFLGEDPGGRNDSEYDSDGWTIETEEGGAGGGGIEWRVAEEGPTRCKPRVPQIASPRSVVAALDASTLRPANYLFTPAQ